MDSATRTIGPSWSRLLRAYYLGPDHPVKLRVWGWLRRSTGYPRLTVPFGRGGWLTLDERDWLQSEIWGGRDYEPEVWDALAAVASRDEVVWDIGAHIGSFSVRAMLDPGVAEVHAFEPEPLAAAALALNVSLNPGGARCTVHRVGLGSAIEMRHLRLGPPANTGLSSFCPSSPSTPSVRVACRTVDDLLADGGLPPPTLMKIDVEGWECHVLAGARRLLQQAPPKAIVLEAACDSAGQIADAQLLDLLRQASYRSCRIQRPNGEIESRENFLLERGG